MDIPLRYTRTTKQKGDLMHVLCRGVKREAISMMNSICYKDKMEGLQRGKDVSLSMLDISTCKFWNEQNKQNDNTYIHIYIYIYVCVCVCVCVWTKFCIKMIIEYNSMWSYPL